MLKTVEIPQLQFIVGLGMHQIETVQKTVEVPQLPSRLGFVQLWTDPTGAVLGHGCDACFCTTTGAWVMTVQ